jgi:hypothetical protein
MDRTVTAVLKLKKKPADDVDDSETPVKDADLSETVHDLLGNLEVEGWALTVEEVSVA